GGILAESAYILLAESGVSAAHELIRKLTLRAEQEGLSFAASLAGEPELLDKIGKQMAGLGLIPKDGEAGGSSVLAFFERPEAYCGLAVKKAKALAAKYRELMSLFQN
ncbi:MAG: adenylosuccinate lyase, partial [Treponema sp.]|nr:adenylosuccinate lyase [Treponema sp.]